MPAPLAQNLMLVVLDGRGAVLHGTPAALELANSVGPNFGSVLTATTSRHVSWQSKGSAWEGSLAVLDLGHVSRSPDISVVVASPVPSVGAQLATVAPGMALVMAVALVVGLWIAFAVTVRHKPALRALQGALDDLVQQRFSRLNAPASRGLRDIFEAWNNAVAVFGRQLATLHAQSQIDQLLLGAAELEAVLGPVLVRLRDLMAAHTVGVTLIDTAAAGHGRLFVASHDNREWPVCRVELDPEVITLLEESPDGLTIARCEEQRHSFLIPMARKGAQLFWTWPVFVGEQLAAILAVGYPEAPRLDARLAEQGTDCAERLGTVLARGAQAEQLYRQAHYDPLTQLPNRLLFRDLLEQAISSAHATASRGALLYVDLDHFKKVNDGLGHAAGDQVLGIVAQRLRACVKENDTVARLGGDEFTVILQQISEPGAARLVAHRIIQALQLPMSLGGHDQQLLASIGIAIFPDDGTSGEELMRNADVAMYRAKDLGRGAATFFDRAMIKRQVSAADTGLYRALKRREFSLFFQPQYAVSDGRLLGVEALLRWESPRSGLRQPAEFIPAAEESGLIIDIGGWVVDAACSQLAGWRDCGLIPPRMALNISLQQLHDPEFLPLVRRLLDKYSLSPDLLEFELKEAAFTDPGAQESLKGLERLGVGLALDNFGSSYAALHHLRKHPARTVKMARSFIEDLGHNPAAAAMAESIIAVAHTLGKTVVAEGVETVDQLEFLRERYCDRVQGYYLARPLSGEAMSELLAAREPIDPLHAATAVG
jgi:diguanylate cyclase (GGDEF)-like protein